MARCPNCKHRFQTLEDEEGMHECPSCGLEPGSKFIPCDDFKDYGCEGRAEFVRDGRNFCQDCAAAYDEWLDNYEPEPKTYDDQLWAKVGRGW